ncbi:hypothetical protein [Flavobacterium sp.]|uniref:hypothetical protein n=1 Tax=Flavobacterium sp. TaxID=239 RepID=UPI0026164E2E|nr:hypothetical protein [Flavobacterium sp.]
MINLNSINYWSFIETYYPNYYSCDTVLLSDILLRKLEGEVIDAKDEALIEGWSIKKKLLELDSIIMEKAMKNYFAIHYPE